MDDLYDADVFERSERQSELLRGRAAGEMVNDAEFDWPNIAEEVESVGRSQLSAVRSNLVQAIAHHLKAQPWPQSPAVEHWCAEARGFRGDAREAFTPSMRQRIDVAELYRRAVDRLPRTIDGQPPRPIPQTCPRTLDELLGGVPWNSCASPAGAAAGESDPRRL
jgi:hypothetical protein